jgi:DnaJ-class molecular chaperone
METDSWMAICILVSLFWLAGSDGGKKSGKCPRCNGDGKVVTNHADAVEIRRGVWNPCEWTTERKCDICLGSGKAREVRRERKANGRETVYYEPVSEGEKK